MPTWEEKVRTGRGMIPTTWQERAQIARDLETFAREQADSIVVRRTDPFSEDYCRNLRRAWWRMAVEHATYAAQLEAAMDVHVDAPAVSA